MSVSCFFSENKKVIFIFTTCNNGRIKQGSASIILIFMLHSIHNHFANAGIQRKKIVSQTGMYCF